MLSVAKAADVVPPSGTNGALRFISSVKIHFREEFVMQLLNLATDQRQQRLALQPGRRIDIEQFTNGRIEIQMRDHRVRNLASSKLPGSSSEFAGASHD